MTREQLKKYAPYLAAGLALAVFLALVFRPIDRPEPPAEPAGTAGDPAPDPQPDPAPDPQPQVVTLQAGTPLFSAPGYDSDYLLTLTETGVYGMADRYENGWVLLDAPEGWADPAGPPPWADERILISEADGSLLALGGFLDPFPETQAVMPVAVRAMQTLTDLRLVTLVPGAELEEDQTLLELVSLSPGTPLVLRINFPGSASLYSLSFTDQTGASHRLVLSESGMDGSLSVNQY